MLVATCNSWPLSIALGLSTKSHEWIHGCSHPSWVGLAGVRSWAEHTSWAGLTGGRTGYQVAQLKRGRHVKWIIHSKYQRAFIIYYISIHSSSFLFTTVIQGRIHITLSHSINKPVCICILAVKMTNPHKATLHRTLDIIRLGWSKYHSYHLKLSAVVVKYKISAFLQYSCMSFTRSTANHPIHQLLRQGAFSV